MVQFVKSSFLCLSLALLVVGQGTQFITGDCTSDADCASGCCAFNSGKCAAIIPALERGEGCGFGGQRNDGRGNPFPAAAAAAAAAPPAANNAAANNAAAGNAAAAPARAPGTQFITGACTSDADCASTCCAFDSGRCAAIIPALERGEGCGFGSGQRNDGRGNAFNGRRRSLRRSARRSTRINRRK